MQKSDPLIRTKIHLPIARPSLVSRPGLQAQIMQGLRGALTLIVAPAGFGKTTLVASCATHCEPPIAWLSLDKNDNQAGSFLNYLIAALQEADHTIGNDAMQLMVRMQQAPSEAVLTSLINDLDTSNGEMILVLDDYQFINSPGVHTDVAFLLEHCPSTFHLLMVTRSDPPLSLARLRARGQLIELRAADLRFTADEAAQFLNEIMGLHLDAASVAILEERTEGWIAGLQMAALSMRDRHDLAAFIKGFSGTNRYILDYLLEEVLAGQSPEVQHFLLHTSILERLTSPLCDLITEVREQEIEKSDELFRSSHNSQSILEYLEKANLFLVPQDDERVWYRYHHLFADLLRAQLHKSLGDQGVAQLHLRASEWYEQNSLPLDAIHHASMASDDERVERLIEENYLEMMNRGEMSSVRFWMGKLSKELVTRRPWLCLYEALNRSWFGQLEEANLLLNEAEKRIRSDISVPDSQTMLGYHAYVKSRVTAMQGDTLRAIEYCLRAREHVPADSLGLQIDFSITLGYEYFLSGDFVNASQTLEQTIQFGHLTEAVNNPVAAYCLLARMHIMQGRLQEANDLFQKAAHLIPETGRKYRGVLGLVEVGIAALLYEWNQLEAALVRLKAGMDCLPMWGKADDLCLAYITLSRIQQALGNQVDAAGTLQKAVQLIQTCGVFSEARNEVETSQVNQWLSQGNWMAIERWMGTREPRVGSPDPFQFEDELPHLAHVRVLIAQSKWKEAINLLICLEKSAGSGGRQGRLIEILLLKALAFQGMRNYEQADAESTKGLTLAELGGYVRIFLDEGQLMRMLLAQWLSHNGASPLRNYARHLLSQFDGEKHSIPRTQEKASSAQLHQPGEALIEPLSQRELEVLHLMALGKTNLEIAGQLIVAPGTIKAHAASIYRKLDAANRTEAVTRARQLGILS